MCALQGSESQRRVYRSVEAQSHLESSGESRQKYLQVQAKSRPFSMANYVINGDSVAT